MLSARARARWAAAAMPLAISKMRVEMPLLDGIGVGGPSDEALSYTLLLDQERLARRASRYGATARRAKVIVAVVLLALALVLAYQLGPLLGAR